MTQAAAQGARTCPKCGRSSAPDALFCPIDGTPLAAPAQPGAAPADPYLGMEISGHIEVRQLVGVGAMGRVYRAFQKGIDRDVAVKILHRELSSNPQLVSRFHREAKVASRLQHPNVVQVHLAGQLADGALYIVMEYLDGLSLSSALVEAGAPLSLSRALHVTLQICAAVGEGHAQGVVHRDLKPENVMLVRRGEDPDYVKVLDFGIAKISTAEPSVATAAGLIFGTARYISPEGAQGEQVGPPGDVYAIATMLYQMLAGRTPFEGDQAVALLVQQLHDAPPPLKSLPRSAQVPDPIAAVVMASLAKRPADRPETGRALGRALVDAARASGLSPEDFGDRLGLIGVRNTGLGPRVGTGTEVPEAAAAPGPSTTKWTPPPGLSAQLVPRAATSSVDMTMDDADGVLAPALTATPAPISASAGPPRPAPTVLESPAALPASAAVADFVSPRPVTPAVAFIPPAPAPADGARGTEPGAPRLSQGAPPRFGVPLIVLGCFFVGLFVAIGVAYKLGSIGNAPRAGLTVDEVLTHAAAAAQRKHWDGPPGDNVRDITNEGLARFPAEGRILQARARTASELVTLALEQRAIGELSEAIHLARLAAEMDPSQQTATRLLDKLQSEYDESVRLPPLASGSVAAPGTLALQPAVPVSGAVAPPRPSSSVASPVASGSAVGASPSPRGKGAHGPAASATAAPAPPPSAGPPAPPPSASAPRPAPSVKWM